MFNLAIFQKTLRDSGVSIVLSALGIVGFQVLFVWAMLNMGTDLMQFISKFPFLTKIFEMGFGIKVGGKVSLTVLFAICFTHAIVLALTWGVIIATATRTTVGEVERGTADMLLTLPVSRPEVYTSTSLVWLFAAVLMSICPLVGMGIALQIFETKEVIKLSSYLAPATNFFTLNLAVGSLALLISCFLDRRGVAVGTIVGLLLCSVVLNFVEPFIEFIKHIRFLGLLNYFRPVDVVRTGQWPISSMLVLVGLAAICWTIGLITFSRRDIPTA
jgi:ABC-2 type transport system permease protein